MKTRSNQVRSKNNANRITSQVQPPVSGATNGAGPQASGPELVQPCDLEDSLDHLRDSGTAAASLCVLNAHSIDCLLKNGQSHSGRFNSETFGAGNIKLAQALDNDFYLCLLAWEQNLRGMLQGRKCSALARYNMTRVVSSLAHVLYVQADFLEAHALKEEYSSAVSCGTLIIGALRSAWAEGFDVSNKLMLLHKSDNKSTRLKNAA